MADKTVVLMPIRYTRSAKRQLAVIVMSPPFSPAEIVPYSEQHRAAGGWSDGILCDLRDMAGPPLPPAAMLALAEMVGRRRGDRPRIAILTDDPTVYERTGAYSGLAKLHPPIAFFYDEETAETWLTAG